MRPADWKMLGSIFAALGVIFLVIAAWIWLNAMWYLGPYAWQQYYQYGGYVAPLVLAGIPFLIVGIAFAVRSISNEDGVEQPKSPLPTILWNMRSADWKMLGSIFEALGVVFLVIGVWIWLNAMSYVDQGWQQYGQYGGYVAPLVLAGIPFLIVGIAFAVRSISNEAIAKQPLSPLPNTTKRFCRCCGTESSGDVVFCGKCGARLREDDTQYY